MYFLHYLAVSFFKSHFRILVCRNNPTARPHDAKRFEDLLDLGVNKGWYSPDNYLEAYVKIPWCGQYIYIHALQDGISLGFYSMAAARA